MCSPGFRRRSCPEPGYCAKAGAVTSSCTVFKKKKKVSVPVLKSYVWARWKKYEYIYVHVNGHCVICRVWYCTGLNMSIHFSIIWKNMWGKKLLNKVFWIRIQIEFCNFVDPNTNPYFYSHLITSSNGIFTVKIIKPPLTDKNSTSWFRIFITSKFKDFFKE